MQLVINKGDYDQLLGILKTMLGIELVVSPRSATADFMRRTLSSESVVELAVLPKGGRILEVKISHSSPIVGSLVQDIALPPNSLFVALQHKFKAKVPTAEDTILAGDRVIVLVHKDQEKALLKRLI